MKTLSAHVLLAFLLLLGAPLRGWCDDKVLVPGDPPLTQANVDLFQQMWEWYCDIRLTAQEGDQLGKAFTSLWRKRTKTGNQQALDSHRSLEKEWRALLEMKGEDRERQRVQRRDTWIKNMRQSKDDVCLLLVPIYDAAYKPGGTNNPIVVAGDPPLTQQMIDVDRVLLEILLDLSLTVEQRKEHQRLMIEEWKNWNQEKRTSAVQSNKKWGVVLSYSNYSRHVERALTFPKALKRWVKNRDTDPFSRWTLELYESSSKPDSDHNPVLVAGNPPLTQLVVDRYRDYVEIMLDMAVSGGLTTPQRQVLQDYLVKDWKNMTAEERKELLADLKRWENAAGESVEQAKKSIAALRPKLLARLQTTDNRESSKWLLEIVAQERKKEEQLSDNQRMCFEAAQFIIRQGVGSWQYNQTSRRYEWNPNR